MNDKADMFDRYIVLSREVVTAIEVECNTSYNGSDFTDKEIEKHRPWVRQITKLLLENPDAEFFKLEVLDTMMDGATGRVTIDGQDAEAMLTA